MSCDRPLVHLAEISLVLVQPDRRGAMLRPGLALSTIISSHHILRMLFPLGISVPVSNPRDPAYNVAPGQGYDGVALILLPGGDNCTGTLLSSGQHILTAAHCFEEVSQDGEPDLSPSLDEVTVVFRLPRMELRVGRFARLFCDRRAAFRAHRGLHSANS